MADAPEAPAPLRQRVFVASWLSYFSYYFTRMPFKAAKTSLQAEFGLTKAQLNWIDTAYNVAYCLGQVGNGFLADRLGPRRWVAAGMLTSAALAVAFQAVDSLLGAVLGVYMLVWGLNGLAQSTGWPGNARAMASWYGTARRGEVMGLWSTCYQAGGLAATFVAARLIAEFGWRGVFVGPAIWVAVVAVAFYLLVRDRPSEMGYRDPDAGADGDAAARRAAVRAAWPVVLRTPMVWVMGVAYFCCKSIRYAFLFWLPFYLETALDYGKATSLDMSMAFEAGGIVAVICAGLLADRVFGRRRVFTALLFLVGLIGALYLYRTYGDRSATLNVVGLLLVGGCLFAADSLISGAVAQDLGGPHAAALAAGLVNGIGSIGQVLSGFVLVYVSERHGWATLFEVFMGLAALGAACLLPYVRVAPRAA
jgi:sugar phosphate permease